MPMGEPCKIIPFRPVHVQERKTRTYTVPHVKKILYCFARDLGCKWRKQRLEKFIDTVFDSD